MKERADILVLGGGLAGGIAAITAAQAGLDVIIVNHGEAASSWAQGGIVYPESEHPDDLIQDILKAGSHKNNIEAVNLIAEQGREAVKRWLLDELHVPFDTTAGGELDLALEGAHSHHRILHVKDHTGLSIYEKLKEKISSYKNIKWIKGQLVDLLLSNKHDERYQARFGRSRVCGAYIFTGSQEVLSIEASAVILATGGFSQLYEHSTGPKHSRGEGIAAAHRAGARTLHLEYVQFHPTALFIPGEPRYLLTEALRGEGAKLLNHDLKSFVNELAPRDVVSRAIHEEMIKSGTSHVWLDLRHMSELHEKFPTISLLLKSKGFDPRQDLIPIVPAAHYTLGGVWTDLKGATSVDGLFAAGEVACTGLHGANRLASTSLLEAMCFGELAAQSAVDYSKKNPLDFQVRPWRSSTSIVDPALLQQDWQILRQTLWNYVGLVRSEKRLRRAEHSLSTLRNDVEKFYSEGELSEDLISLRHGVLLATLLLYSALKNRESVGTHYLKEDY